MNHNRRCGSHLVSRQHTRQTLGGSDVWMFIICLGNYRTQFLKSKSSYVNISYQYIEMNLDGGVHEESRRPDQEASTELHISSPTRPPTVLQRFHCTLVLAWFSARHEKNMVVHKQSVWPPQSPPLSAMFADRFLQGLHLWYDGNVIVILSGYSNRKKHLLIRKLI